MISSICGKVIEKGQDYLVVDTGNICYEVFIPRIVMQRLDENIYDDKISLKTYHYLQVEPAKTTPILIGFLNDVEKDFFEIFITVSGIGPRAALKALNKPISLIAQAIDEADTDFLKSLPGIGEQRARQIIAKLQNKVGKFGLIRDGKIKEREEKTRDLIDDVMNVLMQLGYKKQESSQMIKKALEISPNLQTTEDLLNVVYKQRKK